MMDHRRISFLAPAVALFGFMSEPASASVHLMQIEQVIGGVNGDTTAQAIQLRMRAFGQRFLAPTRIRVWDASGQNPIVVINFPSSVSNGSPGARVLIASTSFSSYTSPPAVADFTLANPIPLSYLAAGSMTFETDSGFTVYWRLSWGGASYTGSNSGSVTNDADGNFGPPFPGPLPSSSLQAVQFQGSAFAMSTNNAADYVLTAGAAVFTNNSDSNYTVTLPVETGACCDDATGACTENSTEAQCDALGHRYGGDDSTCVTIDPPCEPPSGACCEDMAGMCTENTTQTDCEDLGRRYGGDGSDCGSIDPPCVPAGGACCDDMTGTCTDGRTEAECEVDSFRYGGDDSDCSTIDPPCLAPTGACCDDATGTCADGMTRADCDVMALRYGGDESACEFIDPPCLMPCTLNVECDDSDPCSFDRCIDNLCSYNLDVKYGDVAGEAGACGPDGDVNLFDILAVLNAFAGQFEDGCEPVNLDIAGDEASCDPNGSINLGDILAVLDAFQGIDHCCADGR